jgi:hypothetical protein
MRQRYTLFVARLNICTLARDQELASKIFGQRELSIFVTRLKFPIFVAYLIMAITWMLSFLLIINFVARLSFVR